MFDPSDDERLEERLGRVEAAYLARGLAPTIRHTPLTPLSLIEALDRRGYLIDGRSLVLEGPLPDLEGAGVVARADIADRASGDWLAAASATGSRTGGHPGVLGRLMALYECPTAFMLLRDGQATPVALLVAAVSEHLATVHNLATAAASRRKGFARELIAQAVNWSRTQGANHLWIAVDQANAPARRLYEGLGLSPLYAYHYRVLRTASASG